MRRYGCRYVTSMVWWSLAMVDWETYLWVTYGVTEGAP